MRSLTRQRAIYIARGGGVAEFTSRGKNATKIWPKPLVSKTPGEKMNPFIYFVFYLDLRRY